MAISIPKPCSESWQNMTPTQKGAFCALCSKEVVDFTQMTKQEIVDYLAANKKACGRFETVQLQQLNKIERSSFKWPSIISLASILAISAPITTLGQEPTMQLSDKHKQASEESIHPSNDDYVPIRGIVTENGKPLPAVKIAIIGTEIKAETDFDGNYSLLHEKIKIDSYTLEFSYAGMETKEVKLNKGIKEVNVIMQSHILGELKISKTSLFFNRIKNWFKN
jgi:hypothetical protein